MTGIFSLRKWTKEDMRRALFHAVLPAQHFQCIFAWSDAQLSTAMQRAREAIARADIHPADPWRLDFLGGKDPTKATLRLLNAEADLWSHSFYTDGLFRLPHEKDSSRPPPWFEPSMVYNGRDPGFECEFPTITLDFMNFARSGPARFVSPAVKCWENRTLFVARDEGGAAARKALYMQGGLQRSRFMIEGEIEMEDDDQEDEYEYEYDSE